MRGIPNATFYDATSEAYHALDCCCAAGKCAVLLLRSSPLALAASPPTCSPQAFAVYPSANPSTSINVLSGVAASASNDIWAVGSYTDDTSGVGQTLVEHYTGSTWSVVASPNPGYANQLAGISLLSSTNIWAVGTQNITSTGPQVSLVEHWDGSQWSVVPSADDPNTGSTTFLYAVSAISASDIWAVGYSSDGPFTEHWDGSSWSVVSTPDLGSPFSTLYGVTAVSSTDVWAVGQEFDSQTGIDTPLVEHWDGAAWSVVSTPSLASSGDLFAVTALSSTDVWAVGDSGAATGPSETLIEHWDGTAWSIVSSPNVSAGTFDNMLLGIAASSASDIWAVGEYAEHPGGSVTPDSGAPEPSWTLALHWNGTAWSIVPSASPPSYDVLSGVVALSPTQVWTVGNAEATPVSPQETLIEHAIKNPIKLQCPR